MCVMSMRFLKIRKQNDICLKANQRTDSLFVEPWWHQELTWYGFDGVLYKTDIHQSAMRKSLKYYLEEVRALRSMLFKGVQQC